MLPFACAVNSTILASGGTPAGVTVGVGFGAALLGAALAHFAAMHRDGQTLRMQRASRIEDSVRACLVAAAGVQAALDRYGRRLWRKDGLVVARFEHADIKQRRDAYYAAMPALQAEIALVVSLSPTPQSPGLPRELEASPRELELEPCGADALHDTDCRIAAWRAFDVEELGGGEVATALQHALIMWWTTIEGCLPGHRASGDGVHPVVAGPHATEEDEKRAAERNRQRRREMQAVVERLVERLPAAMRDDAARVRRGYASRSASRLEKWKGSTRALVASLTGRGQPGP